MRSHHSLHDYDGIQLPSYWERIIDNVDLLMVEWEHPSQKLLFILFHSSDMD